MGGLGFEYFTASGENLKEREDPNSKVDYFGVRVISSVSSRRRQRDGYIGAVLVTTVVAAMAMLLMNCCA